VRNGQRRVGLLYERGRHRRRYSVIRLAHALSPRDEGGLVPMTVSRITFTSEAESEASVPRPRLPSK
jgi:hypothetical protein